MAVTALTAEMFDSTLDDNPIVIIDWWAPWCGPCMSFAPVFEEAELRNPDVKFVKVNTEEQPALAAAAGIMSIPTLMVFREGVGVFQQSGAVPGKVVDEILQRVRDLDMDSVHADLN